MIVFGNIGTNVETIWLASIGNVIEWANEAIKWISRSTWSVIDWIIHDVYDVYVSIHRVECINNCLTLNWREEIDCYDCERFETVRECTNDSTSVIDRLLRSQSQSLSKKLAEHILIWFNAKSSLANRVI